MFWVLIARAAGKFFAQSSTKSEQAGQGAPYISACHRIRHGHVWANVDRVNVTKGLSNTALVASVHSTSTQLLLQMWAKTVSHRNLMPLRNWLDQRFDTGSSGIPVVGSMRPVGLLAAIGVGWVNLTKLLGHAPNGEPAVVNHNRRYGVTALVGRCLCVRFLVSQKQTFPRSLTLVGRRLRRL
jgi:hypothetical protein